MSKKKQDMRELLMLIPVALVILSIVCVLVFRNCDFPDPDSEPETLDTGQTLPTSPSVNFEPPEIDPDIALRQPPEKIKISCDQVGIYTGEFVESGRDEPVEDVALMLLTNKSDKYLEYAKLTYEVDGHTATFVVTGLPAGKSAWVLESNGLKATSTSKFVYVDATTAYKDHVVRAPKELDIKFGNQMLKLTNLTEEPLENVVVYYKVMYTDGKFLGGITYKVSFGTIEPGQSVEKIAGHYNNDWAQIVRVGWQESTSESDV